MEAARGLLDWTQRGERWVRWSTQRTPLPLPIPFYAAWPSKPQPGSWRGSDLPFGVTGGRRCRRLRKATGSGVRPSTKGPSDRPPMGRDGPACSKGTQRRGVPAGRDGNGLDSRCLQIVLAALEQAQAEAIRIAADLAGWFGLGKRSSRRVRLARRRDRARDPLPHQGGLSPHTLQAVRRPTSTPPAAL